MKKQPSTAPAATTAGTETVQGSGVNYFALLFGCFLGLCIWKFGNPIILDQKIDVPINPADWIEFAWPLRWANWILLPLAIFGAWQVFQTKSLRPPARPLWVLPLLWLGWQCLSGFKTVDTTLTAATLWQFFGVVACYFLGVFLFHSRPAQKWLLIVILAAFAFCLVRAVKQRVFEFPVNYQVLAEGERTGWTNFPPETLTQMKVESVIVNTNGVDVANPIILAKFQKARVAGTLVYPNALAGLILLLWPVAIALAFGATKKFKPPIRLAAIALVIGLGGVTFLWTGSKLGWLVGMAMAGLFLLRLDWSRKLKLAAVALVIVLGLGIFAIRFHTYFAAGATSMGARFDYWRAAGQTTLTYPAFGTGPGTFQRPYARLKAPESEMARLTHNDYLEQFSDSGFPGGLAYLAWILLALGVIGRKVWSFGDGFQFALFLGLMGWFIQGLGEFGLYIPALAWLAFTLLGALIGQNRIKIDKKSVAG